MRLLFLALAMCSALVAQQTTIIPSPQSSSQPTTQPANAPQAEKKPGKVEGIVINAVSKEPLRRAEVTLMPMDRPMGTVVMGGPMEAPDARRATSDAEGKFVISDVKPGRYGINAQKSGFLNGRFGNRGRVGGMQNTITVSEEQTVTGVKVELTPQAVISGRVLDEEGEPLQNIQIQVLRKQYMMGRQQMSPIAMGQTNDRGEFRVVNIPPGQALLSATPIRYGNVPTGVTDSAPNMAYVQTYYPGGTDMTQASKIDVTIGAELSGFDIKLLKARVTRIRGKVIGPDGQPMKNAFVQVMPRERNFWSGMGGGMMRRGDGSFEIPNVQPGSYSLFVRGDGGGPRAMTYQQPIEVGTENIDDLVINVPAPTKIEGQLVLKGEPPAQFDLQSVRIMLTSDSGMMFGPPPEQKTNPDGSFVLENVMPGKYRARIAGMTQQVYIDSVIYGSQDVTGGEFEISGSGAPLKVLLETGGGAISGTVSNGDKPAPGMSVLALNIDKNRRDNPFTPVGSSDQNGNFNLKNLAPGDYLVFAFEEMEYGFWYDEERLKKVENKAVKVTVARNGTASANPAVAPLPD